MHSFLKKSLAKGLRGNIAVLALLAASTLTASGPAWYSSAWTSRKVVTIDHTKVSGAASLTSFPMLFSVTDPSLKTVGNGGNVGKSDGTDILFTDSDGVTKLNHEIEGYNGVTGQLIAWVMVPILSPTADTVLYIYYGNGAAANQQNATAVWDSNYKMVQHLRDGTSLTPTDSTVNGHNGTNHGAAATAGQIGGATTVNGVNQYIDTGTNWSSLFTFTTGVTYEAWIYDNGGNNYSRAIIGAEGSGLCLFIQPLDNISGSHHPNAIQAGKSQYFVFDPSTSAYPSNQWNHIAFTIGSGGQNVVYYINGLNAGTDTGHTFGGTYATQISIGANNYSGGPGGFANAKIDEVRVSSSIRSADWISTEFRNQNSPVTFLALGVLEGVPLPLVAAPTFSPVAGTYTTTQTVTISTTTAGASIRYTTDGSSPSQTAGTLYGSPIAINATTTLKAIAYKAVMTDSSISSAIYTISSGSTWYNTGGTWTSRKSISIDHTRVSGGASLSNFPVLFSVTDATLKTVANGGNVGKSDATDILFTGSDGLTKLKHEIESYNGVTGQLIAWVQIPSLSAATNTALYVYYGNASAVDQQNAAAVWDANFKMVQHLRDGTTLALTDSTANGHTGVNHGATALTGLIGGAANTSAASSQYIDTGTGWASFFSGVSAGSGVTYEAWFYDNGGNSYEKALIGSGESGLTLFIQPLDGGTIHVNAIKAGKTQYGGWVSSTGVYPSNQWNHVAYTLSPDGHTVTYYINGANAGSDSSYTFGGTYASQLLLGVNNYYSGLSSFADVKIDEVRISNAVRSAGWIATGYNNQNFPATFVSLGTLEGTSGPAAVSTPSFSPSPGTYTTAQTVTISTATAGASIRYTTDGSPPSQAIGTLYSAPISMASTATLKAMAYKSGLSDSGIASGNYTITASAAAPTFSPAPGTYQSAQSVAISTVTSGASIRYTTDGSTPSSTAGIVYGGAIPVNGGSVTIKAIAYKSGLTDSPVSSATYTITIATQWYPGGWSFRKAITFDRNKVTSNLTNFPILVSLTDSNLQSSAKTDGSDILFTDSDGVTKLSHEIESYSSGQLTAWVRAPSLSPATNTVVYMYYGNSSAGTQQNPTAVWDANYKAVYHLADRVANTNVLDSTSNAKTGTASANTSNMQTSGQVYGGLNFNGTSDKVSVGTFVGPAHDITLEAWIKPSSVSGSQRVILQGGSSADAYLRLEMSPNNRFRTYFGNGGWGVTTSYYYYVKCYGLRASLALAPQ